MKSVLLQPLWIDPRQRKLLSAALALGLVCAGIAAPASMISAYMGRQEEVEALRAEINRLAERAIIPGARQSVSSSISDQMSDMLSPNAEAAAAHLQATLRSLSATMGMAEIRVESVRILPALDEGTATAVRASASLTTPGPHVFDVVNALEASTPPIVIDSLRVVARTDASGARGRNLPGSEMARGDLTLTLRVYARSSLSAGSSPPRQRRASRASELP